jgi:transposase-like protein
MSQPQVSEMAESFDARVVGFRNRPHDDGPTTYVWLDVLFHKIGDGGRVVGVATVIATGINVDGHREVLGVDVITTPGCGRAAHRCRGRPVGLCQLPQ